MTFSSLWFYSQSTVYVLCGPTIYHYTKASFAVPTGYQIYHKLTCINLLIFTIWTLFMIYSHRFSSLLFFRNFNGHVFSWEICASETRWSLLSLKFGFVAIYYFSDPFLTCSRFEDDTKLRLKFDCDCVFYKGTIHRTKPCYWRECTATISFKTVNWFSLHKGIRLELVFQIEIVSQLGTKILCCH